MHSLQDGCTTVNNWNGNASTVVEYFTNEKVRATATTLSRNRYSPRLEANSTFMLVTGGEGTTPLNNTVDCYDLQLVRTTLTTMRNNRANHCIGRIYENILIAGGRSASSTISKTAEYYNENKVRANLADLPEARASALYTSTQNHFLIAGGSASSYSSQSARQNTVYYYDANLVRGTATALTVTVMANSATTINNRFAIFPDNGYIDIYNDKNLTKTTMDEGGTTANLNTYEWRRLWTKRNQYYRQSSNNKRHRNN